MDRKRLVVVIALAVLAIIGYAAGALGRSDDGAGADWRQRLAGPADADPLRPGDLRRISGSCQWDGQVLRVPSSCTLRVDPLAQQLTTRPVRTATLRSTERVHVVLVVEGKRIELDLDPGKDLRVTAGPAGTDLALACLAPAPTQCLLTQASA